jgi:hypothetical protein
MFLSTSIILPLLQKWDAPGANKVALSNSTSGSPLGMCWMDIGIEGISCFMLLFTAAFAHFRAKQRRLADSL